MIREDVCRCVWWFFNNGKLTNGINSSVMLLIPKVEDANFIEQFRPIACSNFILKIITRIIASRLGEVAARIILKQQIEFVKGRRISHSIALALKGINVSDKKSSGGHTKVDIRKAFDTLDWGFLMDLILLVFQKN